MSFLTDLALAHQHIEGWFPGSVSQRNNNPGNLDLTPEEAAHYGALAGAKGFAHFPSYAAGFNALIDDVQAKITGHSAHIDYSKNPVFLNYVEVYAPAADHNDPLGYAQKLIQSVGKYGVTLNTPLSALAVLIQTGVLPMPDFYSDVPAGSWYEKPVRDCLAAGIIDMQHDGLFHPGQPLSRAEAAAMFSRLMTHLSH